MVLTETYPEHALSLIKPALKTNTELLQFRKKLEKEDIRRKKEGRDTKVAHLQKV